MQFNIEPGHIVAFVSGAAAAWGGFKAIAGWTGTTKDDEVVAKVEAFAARQRELVLRYAPALFTVVEVAAKTGAMPKGADKWLMLLDHLRVKVEKETGREMTPDAVALAKQLASQMASDQKEAGK